MHILEELSNKIQNIRKDLSLHNSQEALNMITEIEDEIEAYGDRDGVEIIDMSYRDDSAGLKARIVWQYLFNWYRNDGGDLDNMDSILCDFGRLQKTFENGGSFCFHFWFNGSATHMHEWHDTVPYMTIYFDGNCLIYIEKH